MGQWSEAAHAAIEGAHAALPPLASLDQRKAALARAYPFEERKGSPYKAWLKARRAYLERYRGRDPQALLKSPLWRAAAKQSS